MSEGVFGLVKLSTGLDVYGMIRELKETLQIKDPMVINLAGSHLEFVEFSPYVLGQQININKAHVVSGPNEVLSQIEELYVLYRDFYQQLDDIGSTLDKAIPVTRETLNNFIERYKSRHEIEKNEVENVSSMTTEQLDEFFGSLKKSKRKVN